MVTNKIKVLIVDDNPIFVGLMTKNLESKNCLVKSTSDQHTALSLLLNEIFHIVFIDCILHSGQGTDLTQMIRSSLGHSVEIIMMSGVVAEKSLSNYIDTGTCDFLSKPISDKELEENLNKVKDKIVYGSDQNILTKLFVKNDSDHLQKLKLLVSLSKAKDYEFFLYLNSLLSSKESLNVKFYLNNKKHTIYCNNGGIVNYESEISEDFLNKLLSKKLINNQEASQLRGQSQKNCVNSLLKYCILSSVQILDAKYDLLIEALKEIVPGMEVSFTVNLTVPEKDSFLLLNHSEYANLIFFFLKQKFNNHLFPLFNEEVMKKSLTFEGNVSHCLPEAEIFLSDLKSGMKLKGIYNKYTNDKSSFCIYLLYILLKGNVYFSESSMNIKYYYLYERYQSLYKFIEKINKSQKIFLYFSGLPSINVYTAKNAYLNFIKHNHPDKFAFDLPKDLLNLIDKVLLKMKYFYDFISDPNVRTSEEKKKKQVAIKEEILFTEKKKIFERYLEKKQYEQAFVLIESIPQKAIDEDIYWQLLYLWLDFENTNKKIEIVKVREYMKNVQKKANELTNEKLYHHILGLHYKKKNIYRQAQTCFLKAKALDPSFQAPYTGINQCSLELLKEKQNKNPLVFKLINSFNNLRKNKKKAG